MGLIEDEQYPIMQIYIYILEHNCIINKSKINNDDVYLFSNKNSVGIVGKEQLMFPILEDCGL